MLPTKYYIQNSIQCLIRYYKQWLIRHFTPDAVFYTMPSRVFYRMLSRIARLSKEFYYMLCRKHIQLLEKFSNKLGQLSFSYSSSAFKKYEIQSWNCYLRVVNYLRLGRYSTSPSTMDDG